MHSTQWINNFASICSHQNINNSTDIDNLFNNKMENENIIRMLELKGETLSLINGREEFDLTEDEKMNQNIKK